MDKKVIIAGIGMGNPSTATLQVIEAINDADMLIGAKRMLEPFSHLGKKMAAEYVGERIARLVHETDESEAKNFVILVSGDPGLYSGAQGIAEALAEFRPRVLAGISSVSYFCSAIGESWSDTEVISAHGRRVNIASEVRRNRRTFVLTDGNISELLHTLCEYGFGGLDVYIGEKLSYEEENIVKGTASSLADGQYDALSVMLVINEDADKKSAPGLPDEAFLRGDVPMTKREVRAISLSKMHIRPTDIVYDIGAGTGSVSVEAAFAAYRGRVYAIECERDAVELLDKNRHAMAADNIEIVEGYAPEALAGLPPADVVFIGGSNGRLEQIIDALIEKHMEHKASFRLVINAVSLETIAKSVTMLTTKKALKIEYTQVSAARTRSVGEHNLLQAQNPVFIINADFIFGSYEKA